MGSSEPKHLRHPIVHALTRTYAGMLGTLIVMFVTVPVLGDSLIGSIVAHVAYALFLVACVLRLYIVRGKSLLGLAIVLTNLVAATLQVVVGGQSFDVIAAAADAVVALVLLGAIFVDLSHARRVSRDMLIGAITAYLLIGFVFASAHAAELLANPAAYEMEGAPTGSSPVSVMIYYSFVTLTTLGFGEITPTSDIARMLTVAEAVVGQMFLAIAIARLVALTRVRR